MTAPASTFWHEVGVVALVGRDVDAGACDHFVEQRFERAIARHPELASFIAWREQHVVFGDIGKAAGHQLVIARISECVRSRALTVGAQHPSAVTSS